MSIVKKIWLGFGLTLLIMLAIRAVAYYNSTNQAATAERVVHTHAVLAGLEQLLSRLQDSEIGQRGYLLADEKSYLEPYNTALVEIPKVIDKLKSLTSDNPTQQRALKDLDPLIRDKLAELKETIDLHDGADPTKAVEVVKLDRGKQIMDKIRVVVADMQDEENRLLNERETAAEATANTASLLIAAGLLLAFVVVGTTAFYITRGVRQSLAECTTATQQVSTASREIAAGSKKQVASLTETATALNQMTTTAEEFKATIQEFADRARAVQEAAEETAKQADEGRSLTQQSADRTDAARINAQTAGENVLKFAEQMQRIGEITIAVNEIAEQTKLLALNASIEAARAGEEGRGFAVVATQVRELANQSKEAAVRINTMIGDTQRSLQDVVSRIQAGSRLSEESAEMVGTLAQSFEQIVAAVTQTTEAMKQIATGARQQEDGITEMVAGMTQVDTASKESLAAADQTRKAIEEINGQIRSLNETMEKL